MHVGRANDASSAFKDLELSQQAKRPFTEKSADSKATSRAEQERAKRRGCAMSPFGLTGARSLGAGEVSEPGAGPRLVRGD